MATVAPCSASLSAIPRPIPRELPVTSANLVLDGMSHLLDREPSTAAARRDLPASDGRSICSRPKKKSRRAEALRLSSKEPTRRPSAHGHAVLHADGPVRAGRDLDLAAPRGEHGSGAADGPDHRALLRAVAAAHDRAHDGAPDRASADDGGVAAVAVRALHVDGGRVEPVLLAADDDTVEVHRQARLAGHAAGLVRAADVALEHRASGQEGVAVGP